MCLILFAQLADPRYRLVVAANRDEFFRRPTSAADYWPGAPGVLAGRDLDKGGTWMGVTKTGRWAAVTNFRDGTSPVPGTRSRGALVADYLLGRSTASAYADDVAREGRDYPGFNLLAGDFTAVHCVSNKDGKATALAPGIYGLSNGRLDAPWPKVEAGKRALHEAIASSKSADGLADSLLAMLANRRVAEDALLPSTGIGRDWERLLSASFIVAPDYGTRASTVLLVDHEGEVHFRERSFGEGGVMTEDRRYRFGVVADSLQEAG